VVFSTLISVLLFAYISGNGLVLGNDPAVHLSTAEMYLEQHHIILGYVLFYPPLYHVWLLTFLSFTGVASIEQAIFLLKCVTVLINWLVIFGIYLIGARFFGKKTGVFAASFILLILPFYEINMWGGYTSIASIALMTLLIS
jgi:asparagine N-glycosylation enzyme membrane subunit Stt3